MRLLRVNGISMDIDDKTSIGVTVQLWDIKEPASRKLKTSNSFTLPLTAKNIKVFGFGNEPSSTNTTMYGIMSLDYWVNNLWLINSARCQVQSISDRIEILFVEKNDVFDNLKAIKFNDFVEEYLWDYLKLYGFVNGETSTDYTLTEILTQLKNGTAESWTTTYLPKSGSGIDTSYMGIKLIPSLGLLDGYVNKTYEILPVYFGSGATSIDIIFNEKVENIIGYTTAAGGYNVATIKLDNATLAANDNKDVTVGQNYNLTITKTTGGTPALLHLVVRSKTGYNEDLTSQVLFIERPVEYYDLTSGSVVTDVTKYLVNGGKFAVYAYGLLRFIENKYNITITGNVFDSGSWNKIKKIYIPYRKLNLYSETGRYSTSVKWGFRTQNLIINDAEDTEYTDKTAFDFFNSLIKQLGLTVDVKPNNIIELNYIDKLPTSEIIDFGSLSGKAKLTPFINNYGQKSIIKYSTVYEGLPELTGAKIITCENKNITYIEDLFEVDAYRAGFIDSMLMPDLSLKDSLKTFPFLYDNTSTQSVTFNTIQNATVDHIGDIYWHALDINSVTLTMNIPKHIELTYTFLDTIAEYPKVYEVQKWISPVVFSGLKTFAQYWIKELGGLFFLNKISNYNPDKSTAPTTFEFIRISTGAPTTIPTEDLEYFTDGVGDNFTDGEGYEFY